MLKRFMGLGALFGFGIGELIYQNIHRIPRGDINHKTTLFISIVIFVFAGTQLYQFSKNKEEKWLQTNMMMLYIMGGVILVISLVLTSFIK